MPRGTRRWGQHLTTCLAVMLVGAAVSQDWADTWCEINDCKGVRAAEQKDEKVEARQKDVRIVTRRYHATGEIRAIKSEHVKTTYFQYDGPTLDHPAFPGVAAEHAERKERDNEKAAVAARRLEVRHVTGVACTKGKHCSIAQPSRGSRSQGGELTATFRGRN